MLLKVPREYPRLLAQLKDRIRVARLRASLSVNRQMIQLYWEIGREIALLQERRRWGTSVIERLAEDIQRAFPGVQGFSKRNIWRMRAFYRAYAPASEKPRRPSQIESSDNFVPRAVAEIPWGHNLLILEQVKDRSARIWYAKKTLENGWSRMTLDCQIETGLYERQARG